LLEEWLREEKGEKCYGERRRKGWWNAEWRQIRRICRVGVTGGGQKGNRKQGKPNTTAWDKPT